MTDGPVARADGAHKNDMYGNIDARSEDAEGVLAPIPGSNRCAVKRRGRG